MNIRKFFINNSNPQLTTGKAKSYYNDKIWIIIKMKKIELPSPNFSLRSFYANYQGTLSTSSSRKDFWILLITFYNKLE